MDVNNVDPGGATLARPPPRRSGRKRETVNYVIDVPQELDDSLHEKGARKRRTRKKVDPVGDVLMELDDTPPHKEGGGMEGESERMPGEATASLTPPAKRKKRKRSVVNAAVDIPMELDDPPHEEEAEGLHGVPGEAATPVRGKRSRRKVDPVVDVPSEPDDPPQEEGGDGETEVESANASVESTTPPPPPRRSTRSRGTVNYVVDVPLDL
jgi:hypothetical protein